MQKTLRRGGNIPSNFSTGLIKRHFTKYHSEELALAEKKKKEEKEKADKSKSRVSTFFGRAPAVQQQALVDETPTSPPPNSPCPSSSRSRRSSTSISNASTVPIEQIEDLLLERDQSFVHEANTFKQQSVVESITQKWDKGDSRAKSLNF